MVFTMLDLLAELTIENSLGSWLIASWIFCVFWAVECVSAYRYFRTYDKDPWSIRIMVSVVLLAGTTKMVVTCSGVYRLCIREFGNYMKAIVPGVEMAVIPATTGLESLLVQSYLIYRFWRISKLTYIA